MTIRVKKIIAREFLIAISIVILSCISFIHAYIHNKNILNIREKYLLEEKIINEKIRENEKLFIKKYSEWQSFNNYTRYSFNMEGNNPADLALYYSKRTKNYMNSYDYQKYNKEFKNYLYMYGIKSEKEYVEYMNKYALNEKESDGLLKVVKYKDKLKKIKSEFNYYYNNITFWDYEHKKNLFYEYVIYTSLILFPIRYLILMIIWSIKTIFKS